MNCFKLIRGLIFFLTIIAQAYSSEETTGRFLQWEEAVWSFPKILPSQSFRGKVGDGLLVAGGRNPETGEQSLQSETWYFLPGKDEKDWVGHGPFPLDFKVAEGASVSLERGLLCIGGHPEAGETSAVFELIWEKRPKTVQQHYWPGLPVPLSGAAATRMGDRIFVVGGKPDPSGNILNPVFFKLDLSRRLDYVSMSEEELLDWVRRRNLDLQEAGRQALTEALQRSDRAAARWGDLNREELKAELTDRALPFEEGESREALLRRLLDAHWGDFQWQTLPPWPGRGRKEAVLVPHHDGVAEALYLMGGDSADQLGEETAEIRETYAFYPHRLRSWQKGSREVRLWEQKEPLPAGARLVSGFPVGQSHLFFFGGKESEKEAFQPRGAVWIYHTITDTWIEEPAEWLQTIPEWVWKGGGDFRVLIPNPGGENPHYTLWKASSVQHKRTFGDTRMATLLNSTVVALYLLSILGVGVWFKKRNKDTNDYFRGGQRVPWLIAGMSIFPTLLSSITFMAVPAKAYATNWIYIVANNSTLLVIPVVVYFILPFFRKINATSAYEYLELRFNLGTRIFGSVIFMLFHIGRMAIVLFLPALALATVTPIGVMECILIMGILSIIYCTFGGFEAVVWTDAIQTMVLFAGMAISLTVVFFKLDGGFLEGLALAKADQKFKMVEWNWELLQECWLPLWFRETRECIRLSMLVWVWFPVLSLATPAVSFFRK